MTASSVELFPCRVQLMGLPMSASSVSSAASANLSNINIGLNRRPPIQKVRRVSRNLFGAPDPIEMKKLYERETERQRKYILGRYNFDSKWSKDVTEDNINENSTDELDNNIKLTNCSFNQATTFPPLIELELKHHDQHRQYENQTLCRTLSEESSPNSKICNHSNNLPKMTRSCCEYTTISPAVDCLKPYTRQSLLTERFNIRKSKVCLSRNTKCYNVSVITTNSLKSTKKVEVPQISENNACNNKNKEDIKSEYNNTCITLSKNNQGSQSVAFCGDKHTAVSLQLVVSTQNVS